MFKNIPMFEKKIERKGKLVSKTRVSKATTYAIDRPISAAHIVNK